MLMGIIMVTSRGPYSYDRGRNGFVRRDNVGGVATGLKNVLEKNGGDWICWGDGSLDSQYLNEDNGKYRIHRIILDQKEKKGIMTITATVHYGLFSTTSGKRYTTIPGLITTTGR